MWKLLVGSWLDYREGHNTIAQVAWRRSDFRCSQGWVAHTGTFKVISPVFLFLSGV